MDKPSPAKSSPLCKFTLPSGRACGQPALSGEPVCRHHVRTFRHHAQQVTHEQAMERYVNGLLEMNLFQLLLILRGKLDKIRKTLPRWDQARVTLDIVILQLQQEIAGAQPASGEGSPHPTNFQENA